MGDKRKLKCKVMMIDPPLVPSTRNLGPSYPAGMKEKQLTGNLVFLLHKDPKHSTVNCREKQNKTKETPISPLRHNCTSIQIQKKMRMEEEIGTRWNY